MLYIVRRMIGLNQSIVRNFLRYLRDFANEKERKKKRMFSFLSLFLLPKGVLKHLTEVHSSYIIIAPPASTRVWLTF